MTFPTRRLGRTEHHSSVAVLGGAAYMNATTESAARSFEAALARGVNHLDIAPRYGNAEDALGPLVAAAGESLFVACKSQRTNPDGVRAQLEVSLGKLGRERFDLYQAHGVTSLEDLDARSDAITAICQARDEGLTRFVGITGHDLGTPRAQRRALERFDLDTVMFPVYPRVWADPTYRADAEDLLAECARRDVGVMVIKAVAWKPWGTDAREPGAPWYRPHRSPGRVRQGVEFALSTPGVHALCTPGDVELLPLVLDAVEAALDGPSMDADGRDLAVADASEDEVIFPLRDKAR